VDGARAQLGRGRVQGIGEGGRRGDGEAGLAEAAGQQVVADAVIGGGEDLAFDEVGLAVRPGGIGRVGA
jgi:hypothetical protein